MIRAVIFDMDDTLYIEGDFFRSGFAHIARHLEARGAGPAAELAPMLEAIHFSEGREQVLNKAAERVGFPREWVPELVVLFRSHVPVITLSPDVVRTLERLRSRYKLGCITDGHADVQRRKIEALRLDALLDVILVSDEHGRDYWKPSAFLFKTCCDLLGVGADEAVFVGDNPERDMRGARNAGMRSIRLRHDQGYFRDIVSEEDRADFEITSLDELELLLYQLDYGLESTERWTR